MPNPLEDVARGLRVLGEQLRKNVGGDPATDWIADRLDSLRPEPDEGKSLAELQAELDSLVGLETVKEQVRALVAFPHSALACSRIDFALLATYFLTCATHNWCSTPNPAAATE